jgi:hypothetical protein
MKMLKIESTFIRKNEQQINIFFFSIATVFFPFLVEEGYVSLVTCSILKYILCTVFFFCQEQGKSMKNDYESIIIDDISSASQWYLTCKSVYGDLMWKWKNNEVISVELSLPNYWEGGNFISLFMWLSTPAAI